MAKRDPVPFVYGDLDEQDLVARARCGDANAFRGLMKRGNQRLFRVARSIVKNDEEAEDVVQEAYMRGFSGLAEFRGDSSVFTWLTRITINEANGRLRRRRNIVGLDQVEIAQGKGAEVIMFPNSPIASTPEFDAERTQMRRILESAIDDLPEDFRVVFILRDVEDCTIAETAESLSIRPETVKTRLHRARRLLRAALSERLTSGVTGMFPFLGERCDRITEAVMARLQKA